MQKLIIRHKPPDKEEERLEKEISSSQMNVSELSADIHNSFGIEIEEQVLYYDDTAQGDVVNTNKKVI